MGYDRDYSVIEIKKFLAISEQKYHPWNLADKGHGFSLHHNISDANVVAKKKSAFIISEETNAYRDTLDASAIGKHLKTRTISDQPFMIASILNSAFGQAALALLNCREYARITIHAMAASTPGTAMRMRTAGAKGSVNSSNLIRGVVIIIDNGGINNKEDYLHFVTAYPTTTSSYKFKIGANILRMNPGVELMRDRYKSRGYVWDKTSQTDSGGRLMWCV